MQFSNNSFSIRQIILFLVYTNLWISIAAAALTFQTALIFSIELSKPIYTLVFFATLFVYNYQAINSKHSVGDAQKLGWIKNHKQIIVGLLFLSFIGVLASAYYLPLELFYIGLPGAFLAVLYSTKFFDNRKKALRDIAFVKIYLISISWVLATVILPLVSVIGINRLFSSNVIIYVLMQFVFIIAITIPFDIRDLKYDKKEKKTIPQLIGVKPALLLSFFLLISILAMGLVWWQNSNLITTNKFLGLFISIVVITPVILSSDEKKKDLFYTGLIDGLILVQVLIVYSFMRLG